MFNPPGCCRAVQRHILGSSDSLWISDEALGYVFERFVAVSRTRRRYGTFVPGPMESRRRLGKRRLAHMSGAFPTTSNAMATGWGLFGEVDRTQWHWEPPTMQGSNSDDIVLRLHSKLETLVPTWMVEWGTTPQCIDESTSKPADDQLSVQEDAPSFRDAIFQANLSDAITVCQEFNYSFSRSLSMGIVPGEVFSQVLRDTRKDIRWKFLNSGLADHQCLAFYQAAWEGISSCSVSQSPDFDAAARSRLLECLSMLSTSLEAQALSRSIIISASDSQLRGMTKALTRLFQRWSWDLILAPGNSGICLSSAKQAIQDAGASLRYAKRIVKSVQNDPEPEDLIMLKNILHRATTSVLSGIDNITKAENINSPIEKPLSTLSEILRHLPKDILSTILRSCSRDIRSLGSGRGPEDRIRRMWLTLVSQLPNADDELFTEICNRIDAKLVTSDHILDHWISQHFVMDEALIRNSFNDVAARFGNRGFAALLFVISMHKKDFSAEAKALFGTLLKLGRHKEIHSVLSEMQCHGLKLPMQTIARIVKAVSHHNLRLAFNIYNISFLICPRTERLKMERLPSFIISMVHDPAFPPETIWKVLGIPLYEKMRPPARSRYSPSRLSANMERLIVKMAVAFATSHARPRRVALRNVLQCLHHLRRHNAAVTPDLTRALSHVGITRKIMSGETVSKDFLYWALGLIKWVEGVEVAAFTGHLVEHLHKNLSDNRRQLCRERNVLRVGLIN